MPNFNTEKLSKNLGKITEKLMPDSFIVAVYLTFISIISATIFGRGSIIDQISAWGGGFWNLLAFSMQMTIILLSGYILAKTPFANYILDKILKYIKTPKSAIIAITFAGAFLSWLNWGLGLVAGGILAQKAALKFNGKNPDGSENKDNALHYPLAIAAGFSGFSIYGIGLSGSVPLVIATSGHFLSEKMGIIEVSETIFNPIILAISASIMFILPFFNAALHPKDNIKTINIPAKIQENIQKNQTNSEQKNTKDKKYIGIAIGLLGLAYVIIYFSRGGKIDLNIINIFFLMAGLLLFASPKSWNNAVNDGMKTVAPIIIQYPFYAAIMAVLISSGLAADFASLFVKISNENTLPLFSFISAGIINIFIPSGGGQWAVQGPIMIDAATKLGANYSSVALSVQIGDQWTNLIQPFWVLPALAISGLGLKDVMPWLLLIFTFTGAIFTTGVLLLGFV